MRMQYVHIWICMAQNRITERKTVTNGDSGGAKLSM